MNTYLPHFSCGIDAYESIAPVAGVYGKNCALIYGEKAWAACKEELLPALEKAGVYMADRDTVNKSERMKVTVCLNPIHSALGTYGVVFGYDLFSDEMRDEDMLKLGYLVGAEGMEVVPDPKILSPEEFFLKLYR